MTNLKVGDRVMVYGWVQMHHTPYQPRGGGKATVVWVSGTHVHVKFDAHANGEVGGDQTHYSIHPKQCRRLIMKQRRRWAVKFDRDGAVESYTYELRAFQPGEAVEFIEVRQKKCRINHSKS